MPNGQPLAHYWFVKCLMIVHATRHKSVRITNIIIYKYIYWVSYFNVCGIDSRDYSVI